MAENTMHPVIPKRGPANCPYCEVILTKTEAAGAACPSCREPFAVVPEPGPDDCPKCRGPLRRTRIDCGVCGWCGLKSTDWVTGPKRCPKCNRKLLVMELPATICESCNSVSVDTQPIRLMHLRQILGFLIFIMAVVWPVLDLWSPQFSIWLSESYGIKIPIFVRLVMAVLGGGIAAAIATTHHRFRKVAFFCGLIGGLASFGLAWYGLREFAELRGENIISNALFLVALLGMAPAWGLYILLKSRDRQLNPIAEADDTA